MSAISLPRRVAEPLGLGRTPYRDVTDRVKCWGRRGIFFGGTFGIALGAIFVAMRLSTDVLAFGVIGTLLVGAVECAVIAGGFAALGAALFANGGGKTAQFERKAGRRSAGVGHQDGDVPLADWPCRWTYPVQPTRQPLLRVPDEAANAAFSMTDARARLNTIDAWENGNCGP